MLIISPSVLFFAVVLIQLICYKNHVIMFTLLLVRQDHKIFTWGPLSKLTPVFEQFNITTTLRTNEKTLNVVFFTAEYIADNFSIKHFYCIVSEAKSHIIILHMLCKVEIEVTLLT